MSLVDRKLTLREGLHEFPAGVFGTVDELLHSSQIRERDILMITCSELGAAPDEISFKTQNRCVILQHLAGSVPSSADCARIEGLAFDDVEAMFDKYDFRHIIVCGHLNCAVIRNWLGHPPIGDSDVGNFRDRFQNGTRDLSLIHISEPTRPY